MHIRLETQAKEWTAVPSCYTDPRRTMQSWTTTNRYAMRLIELKGGCNISKRSVRSRLDELSPRSALRLWNSFSCIIGFWRHDECEMSKCKYLEVGCGVVTWMGLGSWSNSSCDSFRNASSGVAAHEGFYGARRYRYRTTLDVCTCLYMIQFTITIYPRTIKAS